MVLDLSGNSPTLNGAIMGLGSSPFWGEPWFGCRGRSPDRNLSGSLEFPNPVFPCPLGSLDLFPDHLVEIPPGAPSADHLPLLSLLLPLRSEAPDFPRGLPLEYLLPFSFLPGPLPEGSSSPWTCQCCSSFPSSLQWLAGSTPPVSLSLYSRTWVLCGPPSPSPPRTMGGPQALPPSGCLLYDHTPWSLPFGVWVGWGRQLLLP